MSNKFDSIFNSLITEMNEYKLSVLEQLVINHINNHLHLNFSDYNISFNKDNDVIKFILQGKYGNITLEIDENISDTFIIYARITNTKILAMNELASNMEVFSQELPLEWNVLENDGWIITIEKAIQTINNLAKKTGLY